ncbi:MAG TPA: peptidoglycan DD-metalloendopeptidase family protein, partial [Mycobacteriales bacterium]|nr:peptidoglycan DD-metalloendopeptidase family protein [Mycobacteriales bacterium]
RPRRRTVVIVVVNALQVLLTLAVFTVHTEAAVAAATPGYGWPLAGDAVVTRPFQPPATAWGAGHRGVDLAGQEGDAVLSAGPGRVSYAGQLAGRGVVVVVHDGGLRTTYEPVVAEVTVGELVTTGSQLGFLGRGHDSCGPGTSCLHWGLLRGETYLDPLSLVTQGRLRLLPLGDGRVPAAGLLASTIGRPDPVVPVAPAVAEPRRRATTLFLLSATNLATAAFVLWGLVALTRRAVRLVKRRG